MKYLSIILVVILTGCTHAEWKSPGIMATQVDNPKVTVTSDIEVIKRTPIALEPPISIRPSPDLRSSYECALEKYFTEGTFRIISCEMTTSTLLFKQHVIFSMLVEANGHIRQTRYEWRTSSAGLGGKPVKMIPNYLDASAKILYQKLNSHLPKA